MVKEKLLREINVGGKIVRLFETADFYEMYEGKKLVYKFVKEYISKKVLWLVVSDYCKYLKQMQNEFVKGDMPIDKIVAEVEKQMHDEFDKRLKKFFKTLKQKNLQTNKEAFLSGGIFPRFDKIFSGFNTFINKIVSDTLNKMHVEVSDDVDDTGIEPTKDIKKLLNDKKKLMVKSVGTQVKQAKDNILTGIKTDLSNAMTAGTDTTQIQKDIEKKYNYKNGVAWKTKRAVGGAVRNANTVLQFKKWLKMGFTKYEWITRDDSKVRPKHAKKNHKVYDIKKSLDDVKNWDAYPGRAANCRCTAIVYE